MATARAHDDTYLSKGKEALRLAKRLWTQVNEDHTSLIAAGVAFYGLLALFPALTALMAIAGLMVDPDRIVEQLQQYATVVPDQVMSIVVGQASDISQNRGGGLGLTALAGIVLAIWSASRGMASLIEGMNVAYGEDETRGFFKRNAVVLALTLMLMIGVIVGMLATMAVPILLSLVQLGVFGKIVSFILVWGLLLVFTFGGLSLIYRLGPDHSKPYTHDWKRPGAPAACLLWIVASAGFAFYVGNFGSYNESFGALSGVIVMLLWLWISAFVVLLGAEVNAETDLMAYEG